VIFISTTRLEHGPVSDFLFPSTFFLYSHVVDDDVPLGCLIALEEGASFVIWPRSIRSNYVKDSINVVLRPGDIIVFRGDLVHAGAAYQETNHRIHCYLDSSRRKRPTNQTFFPDQYYQ
jgi:hypothetical protein